MQEMKKIPIVFFGNQPMNSNPSCSVMSHAEDKQFQDAFIELRPHKELITLFKTLCESPHWSSEQQEMYLDKFSEALSFGEKCFHEARSGICLDLERQHRQSHLIKFLKYLIKNHSNDFSCQEQKFDLLKNHFIRVKASLVPNTLHFIWAGGETIPKYNYQRIVEWKKTCQYHKVILWVDFKTTPKDQMVELILSAKSDGIIIQDITEYAVISNQIRHELESVSPNYGKTSDLLRYLILAIFGGIYLDSDVICHGALPTNIAAPKGVLLPPWSQGHDWCLGNDIIFATPHSKVMAAISDLAQKSYLEPLDTTYRKRHVFTIYDCETRGTVLTTGPVFLRKALHDLGILKLADNGKAQPFFEADMKDFIIGETYLYGAYDQRSRVTFKPQDCLNLTKFRQFSCTRGGSDNSWVRKKPPYFKDWPYEQQLEHMTNLIIYEAAHMKALLLPKYIRYFSHSPLMESVKLEKFIMDLMGNLSIKCIQDPALMHDLHHIQFDLDAMVNHEDILIFLKNHVSMKSSAKVMDHIDNFLKQCKDSAYVLKFFEKTVIDSYPNFIAFIYFIVRNYSPLSWKNESDYNQQLEKIILPLEESLTYSEFNDKLELMKIFLNKFELVESHSSSKELGMTMGI